jgi:hypothetical protein
MTTEIPSKNWQELCRNVSELHRGTLEIRLLEPSGKTSTGAGNIPFRSMIFQKQSDCNDVLLIETGLPDQRPAQHRILEPIRIVLRKDGANGRFNLMEILAEEGTTGITFHPGLNSDSLEKLSA